jgi:hypothetical protein
MDTDAGSAGKAHGRATLYSRASSLRRSPSRA